MLAYRSRLVRRASWDRLVFARRAGVIEHRMQGSRSGGRAQDRRGGWLAERGERVPVCDGGTTGAEGSKRAAIRARSGRGKTGARTVDFLIQRGGLGRGPGGGAGAGSVERGPRRAKLPVSGRALGPEPDRRRPACLLERGDVSLKRQGQVGACRAGVARDHSRGLARSSPFGRDLPGRVRPRPTGEIPLTTCRRRNLVHVRRTT